MSDQFGVVDVLEHGAGINDVETVVCKGERTARLDYYGMVHKWVSQHDFVDIAPFNVCAPASQIEQAPPVFDLVVEDVLTSSGSEVENTVGGAKERIELREKRDAGVCPAEAADIAFRKEAPPQCQTIDEFP